MARVTNSMLAANYLTNMNRNLRNMQSIQSQLSSGKEISRPSDDPYKVSRTMQLYTEIDANKQFNENIKDVGNWLDTTDTALGQAGNLFGRVRELMVSAGNASYGDDEKKAVQDEIKQKVHELSQILNTNFDGAYVFGGTKSLSKPVMIDSSGTIQYADKTGAATTDKSQIGAGLNVEVSQGVFIKYNVTATDILEYKDKTGASKNVNNILNDIIKNLNSPKDPTNPGDISKVTGEGIIQVDAIIQNILQKRSEVGAMTNRMESAQGKNEQQNLNMTDILSKTEDIDFTEKMMQYSTMQTIYMAALQTSAKILPATILDYIR